MVIHTMLAKTRDMETQSKSSPLILQVPVICAAREAEVGTLGARAARPYRVGTSSWWRTTAIHAKKNWVATSTM